MMANVVNCLHDSTYFLYLGLPVGKSMRFVDAWKDITDCFLNRLSSWKSKLLSIGGRLILVKSVLGVLPLYYLSLFRTPLKVINTLESIRMRFFGGFKEEEKKISWVKWNSILLDRDKGGLGTGSIKK